MLDPTQQNGMFSWYELVTDDVDASVGRVAALGGSVIVPPKDIPGVGRFAVISDPGGAVVSLITYAPTA